MPMLLLLPVLLYVAPHPAPHDCAGSVYCVTSGQLFAAAHEADLAANHHGEQEHEHGSEQEHDGEHGSHDISVDVSDSHDNVDAEQQHGDGDDHGSHENSEEGSSDHGAEHSGEHAVNHGGGHGGGHGGEHGGHHGGHHTSKVARSIAVMLIFFVAFNMLMIYHTNSMDADIRSISFKMICTTVSIFCAVLFNEALFSFLFEQILPAPPPRGIGIGEVMPWHKVVTCCILFLVFFSLMNYLCYRARDGYDTLFATKSLMAHITAFAGINLFGNIQTMEFYKRSPSCTFLVTIAAFLFIGFLGMISDRLRRTATGKEHGRPEETESLNKPPLWEWKFENNQWKQYDEDSRKSLEEGYREKKNAVTLEIKVKGVPKKYEVDIGKMVQINPATQQKREVRRGQGQIAVPDSDTWTEEAREAEDEMAALVLSFLVLQTLILLVTGVMHETHGTHMIMSVRTVWTFFGLGTLFMVALFVTTGMLSLCEGREKSELSEIDDLKDAARGLWERALDIVLSFFAMCMAWCYQRFGEWQSHRMFEETSLAQVISGFGLTAFAVIGCRIVDCFADRLSPTRVQKRNKSKMTDEESALMNAMYAAQANLEQMSAQWKEVLDTIPNQRLKDLQNVFADTSQQEKGLRTIIAGFGTLVGLAWDKSFEAAVATSVSGWSLARQHPVISRFLIAFCLIGVVLPGWYLYMVPAARRTEAHHERNIREMQSQSKYNLRWRPFLGLPDDAENFNTANNNRRSQSPR